MYRYIDRPDKKITFLDNSQQRRSRIFRIPPILPRLRPKRGTPFTFGRALASK